MKTEFRKMIQCVGIALMLAVHTTAWGTNTQVLADDDFVVDINDDTWIYSTYPTGRVEFAGYKIGEPYHNLTNGGHVIYGDVLNFYTHSVAINPSYHGLESLYMCLSATSHSLMSMTSSRTDFKDRNDLMTEGLSIRDDLGKLLGISLSKFKFTAPDWPYWPSRKYGYLWDGPMPNLLKVDESLWPTAKTIFATSDTHVGNGSVQVQLSVVDYDEYTLSFSMGSQSVAKRAEEEFTAAFRAKHNGMTFDEWNKKRAHDEEARKP